MNQYLPHYAPGAGKPVFEDGEMFTVTVPIAARARSATPEVAGVVAGEVLRLLKVVSGEMPRREIQTALRLKHEDRFRGAYLVPSLHASLIEMTIPDKPRSRLQKYRLTAKGRALLERRGTDVP